MIPRYILLGVGLAFEHCNMFNLCQNLDRLINIMAKPMTGMSALYIRQRRRCRGHCSERGRGTSRDSTSENAVSYQISGEPQRLDIVHAVKYKYGTYLKSSLAS